jgi:hypothetical protein
VKEVVLTEDQLRALIWMMEDSSWAKIMTLPQFQVLRDARVKFKEALGEPS